MSVNKAIILGRLGADPEIRFTQSGAGVCNFNVATDTVWKDKDGQKQSRTEWHRIVVWGNQAEPCSKYLTKGREVYVEGEIQTRSWEDKDGNKRWTTEIRARDVRFIGGSRSEQSGGGESGGGTDFGPGPGPSSGGGSNDGGGPAGGETPF
ncbi:MAG: single-stranded DNA-binding protein [Deltaproteobacteria bacterium]